MPEDQGREHSEQRTPQVEHKREHASSESDGLVPADLGLGYPVSLLGDPNMSGRGNGPVRAAIVQRMQQSHGNRATRQFVQRSVDRSGGSSRLAVQRQDGPDGGVSGPTDAGAPGGVATAPPASLAERLRRLSRQPAVDLAAMQAEIRRASQAEVQAAGADQSLLNDLRTNLSATEFQTVNRMLTQGLLGETSFTNTTDTGNRYTSMLTLLRGGLTISKDVHFIQAGTFGAGAFDALKARVISAVTSFLSGKYKLKIQTPGGPPQEGDGEYPITVNVVDNSSATYPLTLHGGAHGRSGVREDGGDIYELGQGTETSVPNIVLAHESAHMVLGASDEYANASIPARAVYTDHSLMGNFYTEGISSAEIKARHFQFLVTQVSGWFPGRTISIVK